MAKITNIPGRFPAQSKDTLRDRSADFQTANMNVAVAMVEELCPQQFGGLMSLHCDGAWDLPKEKVAQQIMTSHAMTLIANHLEIQCGQHHGWLGIDVGGGQ